MKTSPVTLLKSPLCCLLLLLAIAIFPAGARQQPAEIGFRPMDPEESPWIFRELGSQEIPSEHARFQDGSAFITYRFHFAPNKQASAILQISNQYLVEASSDNIQFAALARSNRKNGPPELITVELTPFNTAAGNGMVYLRISDSEPKDGWGGKIWHITVRGITLPVVNRLVHDVSPRYLPPADRMFPVLSAPTKRLFHFPARGASAEEMILFRTLQGLVNRDRNCLMIADTWKMLLTLQQKGWISGVTEIADASALFTQFPKRDAIVYDPALYGSENLAVMIGAQKGLVVAHPSLIEKYRLRVKEDLRGRWKTTLQGYQDVYKTYYGRFNDRVLVLAAPSKRSALYDYAVAHKAFTFWITGGTDASRPGADRWAEEAWFEKLLAREFAVNIPILGYPQVEPEDGIGENRGVALFSRSAKFLIPADHMPNMSLLSAYPSQRNAIKMPEVVSQTLDKSRAYACLVLSDGDNLCLWNGPSSFMFEYMKAMKEPRTFPVAFTMGPSIVDLNPLAASLITANINAGDTIGCAVSGAGYMVMRKYAEDYGAQRDEVVGAFLDLTSQYMRFAGERWNWIMDYGGPGSERLQQYRRLKNTTALMGGYGQETSDARLTSEEVGSAVAFHSVSRMVEEKDVLQDVKSVLNSGVRPLFLHVFIGNWGINPAQYRQLASELQSAGVTIVTPETLADLYRQSKSQ
jgi:GxGYxY sequence motif in domain of unknown function N-terminal/GxGYxYP putative glycoside hydrolase C-terminal domain